MLDKRNYTTRAVIIVATCVVLGYLFGVKIITNVNINNNSLCMKRIKDEVNSAVDWDLYYAEYLKPKKMLYIGLMSARKNIDTRIITALDTWAKHGNGFMVEVFAGNDGELTRYGTREELLPGGVKVIQLPGVSDTTYPPQKKSFSMIKYMHDHHLDDFDWFIRMDDDAYMKISDFQAFLGRLNSSHPYFIGQAGFGRDAEDYVGLHENYCMGGTGATFSRSLLRKLGPMMGYCLRNLFTEHEDIELGRCVQRAAGVRCSSSWDVNTYFFQNYLGKTDANNIESISRYRRENALILHSNKKSEYQYKLHKEVLSDLVQKLTLKIAKLKQEIREMDVQLDFTVKNEDIPQIAIDEERLTIWNYMAKYGAATSTSLNSQEIPKSVTFETVKGHMDQLAWNSRHPYTEDRVATGDVIEMYHDFNPIKGFESQVNIKIPKSIRHYHYRLRQRFIENTLFLREDTMLKENIKIKENKKEKTVYIIVTIVARPTTFIRFLMNFEEMFLKTNENIALIVTKFYDTTYVSVVEKAVKHLTINYPWFYAKVLNIKQSLAFSRGLGLQTGTEFVHDDDAILLFMDVDMLMDKNLLNNVRRNTIKGKSAYYPIVYGEFDFDKSYGTHARPEGHFELEERAGFWRTYSYGMVSIYKIDFAKTKGFNLSINGWGLEDVILMTEIQNSGLDIFRANEPGLIHVYHSKTCDIALPSKQLIACRNSRASQYAPKTVLYEKWLSKFKL